MGYCRPYPPVPANALLAGCYHPDDCVGPGRLARTWVGSTMSDASTRRFLTATGESFGHEIVVLSDTEADTQAILAPGFGFPCIGFRVTLEDGIWNVVAEPPDAESFQTRVGRYGVPIMFPWPNRMRDGAFTFGGQSYRLPLSAQGQHAIHGLTRERAWTVEASGTDDSGAFCRASVVLGDAPDDPWPFPCRLTVEYRLHGRALRIVAEAQNLGAVPMPMGFGIHPWFEVPFGSGAARGQIELRVPAAGFWELDATTCTTGAVHPIADGFDAREWQPLGGRFIDDVLTDLQHADGWHTAEVRDPENGRSIAVRSDAVFREHVVFAPLHTDVVCLEPYTCATDAFNLDERGIDAGRIVLQPGERWRGIVEIEARP